LPFESDYTERIGEVFFVRGGVLDILEKESPLHHWALGIHFAEDNLWVLLEGNLYCKLALKIQLF